MAPKAHVSDKKKDIVAKMSKRMNDNKTVMVVSIKGLPAAQFQDIKKKLKERAVIRVAKKTLIDLSLEKAKNDALKDLEKYVGDSTAMLFSNDDAFEISGILSESKSPAKAKEGQEAPEDIEIQAGPTDLMPGPDISALSAVGLQPKVENGKIAIAKDATLCKKGEVISAEKAAILAKLDITPFEIGLEPVAAYMEGKVYAGIKINKEEFLEDMLEKYSRSLAFTVSLNYPTAETLPFILGKAGMHEKALSALITEDSKDVKEDAKPSSGEENTDEAKAESSESSDAGEQKEAPAEEAKEETKQEKKEEIKSEDQTK